MFASPNNANPHSFVSLPLKCNLCILEDLKRLILGKINIVNTKNRQEYRQLCANFIDKYELNDIDNQIGVLDRLLSKDIPIQNLVEILDKPGIDYNKEKPVYPAINYIDTSLNRKSLEFVYRKIYLDTYKS